MEKEHTRAIFFLLGASVLWSTGGLLIKLVQWNPVAIAGARSGIAGTLMLLYLRKPIKLDKGKILGAFFYAGTVIVFVIANKLTTAANTILLQYTAPIWVAFLSWGILKEKIRRIDWITIGAVMGGMVLFFAGDIGRGQTLGNVLAVFSGILLSGVVISLKRVKVGSPVEVPLLGNWLTFFISIPFFFVSVPTMKTVGGLCLLGVFQLGLSYILFAEATRYVTALESVLVSAVEPLLNPIWVFLFIGEQPGPFAIWGGIVVVGAVILRGIVISKMAARSKRRMLK